MSPSIITWAGALRKAVSGQRPTIPKLERSRGPDLLLFGTILVFETLVLFGIGEDPKSLWAVGNTRIAAALLVGLPFILSVSVALPLLWSMPRTSFELWLPKGILTCPGWETTAALVRKTWEYERDRFTGSLVRILPSAYLFGGVATLSLAGSALFVAWHPWDARVTDPQAAKSFAVSVATAVTAAFAVHFARVLVRIAGQDFNARMFSWSTRSMVLIGVADAGLFLALYKAGVPKGVATYSWAVLLALFAALVGDRAIDLFLDKAAGLFGLPALKRSAVSPLSSIDGMGDQDIDRFAEEQVLTVHDLAFAPTARLFFNTTHSLQRICDWQDQALLLVYLGQVRAKALFDQLGFRSAIDLQGIARDLLGIPDLSPDARLSGVLLSTGGQEYSVVATTEDASGNKGTQGGAGASTGSNGPQPLPPPPLSPASTALRQALGKALGLDDQGLNGFLSTIVYDESIMRVRVHWHAASGPA